MCILHIQMPSVEVWFDVAIKLLKFFTVDFIEARARPHFNSMQAHLDINMRFSERYLEHIYRI